MDNVIQRQIYAKEKEEVIWQKSKNQQTANIIDTNASIIVTVVVSAVISADGLPTE
jgi:hypothetical protein